MNRVERREQGVWVGTFPATLPDAACRDWLTRSSTGATLVFYGTTRADRTAGGEAVQSLDYECYEEHTLDAMCEIVSAVRVRFPTIEACAVLHRCGMVPVGHPSVLVGVSAPHRSEVFAAAEYGMHLVKSSLPIWKRDVTDSGHGEFAPGVMLVHPGEFAHG